MASKEFLKQLRKKHHLGEFRKVGRRAVKSKSASGKALEWGFDLTDFKSVNAFKTVLRKNKLVHYRAVKKKPIIKGGSSSYRYTWTGKGVKLVTGNNPITGKYSTPAHREAEKGYASYIGIQGEPSKVRKLVKDIKKSTSYIKDESKGKRDFI